jgi:hypothetical protein
MEDAAPKILNTFTDKRSAAIVRTMPPNWKRVRVQVTRFYSEGGIRIHDS